MFWRLSWGCSFPLNMISSSSFQDPAHPHWNKLNSFHWHGEKREQGLRALSFSRTKWALPRHHWAQTSRRTTAPGSSDRPTASTHFSVRFQVASKVCSHQHLLECQLFPHQNITFLFLGQTHNFGNNSEIKWYWNTVQHNVYTVFYVSDFKCANLFDMVKNYFIPPNEASFGNYFLLNVSNLYVVLHNQNNF